MSRVPDFFIVGHPKSGTSALYELLRQHPRIHMPAVEQPNWFARDMAGVPSHVSTYEDYVALFDGASPGQLVGEATPVYVWSRSAAAEIAGMQPAARIIAILREPASYIRSLHLELLRAGIETEPDVLAAIELEPARGGARPGQQGDWPESLRYAQHVRYVEQLRRFHAAFAGEQLLVIVYDDFRANTESTLADVLRFLGIDDRDASRGPAARDVDEGSDAGAGPLGRIASAPVRRRIRAGLARHLLFARPKQSDDELLLELRHGFKPEVQALGDYLERDMVALWGYDSIP